MSVVGLAPTRPIALSCSNMQKLEAVPNLLRARTVPHHWGDSKRKRKHARRAAHSRASAAIPKGGFYLFIRKMDASSVCNVTTATLIPSHLESDTTNTTTAAGPCSKPLLHPKKDEGQSLKVECTPRFICLSR